MAGGINMSIRIDPELKSQAEGILSQLGMNMTGAITMFLMQIVRDKAVPLSLSLDRSPYLSTRETLYQDIMAARSARAEGREGRPMEEILADMERIVAEAEGRS